MGRAKSKFVNIPYARSVQLENLRFPEAASGFEIAKIIYAGHPNTAEPSIEKMKELANLIDNVFYDQQQKVDILSRIPDQITPIDFLDFLRKTALKEIKFRLGESDMLMLFDSNDHELKDTALNEKLGDFYNENRTYQEIAYQVESNYKFPIKDFYNNCLLLSTRQEKEYPGIQLTTTLDIRFDSLVTEMKVALRDATTKTLNNFA